MMVEVTDEEAALLEAEDNSECEVEETIAMKESDSYLEYSLQLLALVHTLTSLSMLIAYYCLKVSHSGCYHENMTVKYKLLRFSIHSNNKYN